MNKITVNVNGDKQTIDSSNLSQLIKSLDIDAKYLAIAINNHVIPSASFDKTTLKDGDNVEIIKPVCGG